MSARAAKAVTGPRGQKGAKKVWRDPDDWYVEPRWCVEALADLLGDRLRGDLIWDPCCGRGTVLEVFAARSQKVLGTDVARRFEELDYAFSQNDFFKCDRLPTLRPSSIIFNPPYKESKAFIRHALGLATHFVAALVPLTFLASRVRAPFYAEHPPLYVAILSRRPSMPPGALIDQLGDRAFKGGKTDYCWLVWDRRQPNPMTRTVWLPVCGQ